MDPPTPPTACCSPALEQVADLPQLAGLFAALSDPNRLFLLSSLACRSEPVTVTEAASCCGVHLSGVSRHLALLQRAGVVESRKTGREVRYQLRRRELAATLHALADWLETGAACCSPTDGECATACQPPSGSLPAPYGPPDPEEKP